MVKSSALDLIGDTPLVALDRVYQGPGRILAKAEFVQPGGSVKDRAAKAVVLAARSSGQLDEGACVVEMTSGNMGAGLAVVCAALGHPLVVTMSEGNSPARARMLEALGAEVVLVPQVDGAPGEVTGADIAAAASIAEQIARERGGFYVDQFNATHAITAHDAGTGAEILRQVSEGIDAFVACVGTGATFMGVSRALKRHEPRITCLAVEPQGCEPLGGNDVAKPRHRLQGSGYGSVPPHWDPALADGTLAITDDEAEEWRRALAHREGLHVGFTAAANVCAAVRLLRSGRLRPDARVVTILCDTGLKY